jgi:membrane protein DedA with SNARE-associated domain
MWQQQASEYLTYLQTHLPLPGFAFFGALLEEIVSPIPSSMVQIGVGSMAQGQCYPWYGIILLGIIGALGNTVGALIPYGIYRLIGAWIVQTLGKWVGLTTEKVEAARAFLQKGARDDVVIFLLRALPFVPILNPSVICGILGIKFSTFLIATFLGYSLRNSYMLTVGFVGQDAFLRGDPKAIGMLVLIVLVIALMVFISRRHAQRAGEPVQIADET